MSKCDISKVYESVEVCPGKRVLPGIRRRMYFIPNAFIKTWPKLPAIGDESPAGSMASLSQYKGDFVLDADKFFHFLDLKDEASNVTFETIGENGSKLVKNVANAVLSGIDDELKGFARQALNEDMVYVYQQRDGKFCVIGNEAFMSHTSPAGDTGQEATSAITTTFAIECSDECPVPTYVGKLYLSENTYIDCATGEEMTNPPE